MSGLPERSPAGTPRSAADGTLPEPGMRGPAPHDKGSDNWPLWSILVVDDEPGMRNFLVKSLVPRCSAVFEAGSAEEGEAIVRSTHVDLIILDIALPGRNGVGWLKELREQGFSGHVILITAFADLDTAIESLRAGASDFILKPFRVPQILNAVKHCHESSRLARENFVLRHTLSSRPEAAVGLVGDSPVMRDLCRALTRVAGVNSTVLLQGESGTGKELAARALHNLSPRAQGPFVPVNCASMSPELMEIELFGHAKGAFTGATRAREGLFYYAQGGTLFLDEVADLPLPLQAMLLRALEDRMIRPVGSEKQLPVNVRIVAATNRSLTEAVAAGSFRKDLYYRLQVVEITLPPLRQHKEDIARAGAALHAAADAVPGCRAAADHAGRPGLPGAIRLARQRARIAQPDRAFADPGRAQCVRAVFGRPGAQSRMRAAMRPTPARRPTCTRWRSSTSWPCSSRSRATRRRRPSCWASRGARWSAAAPSGRARLDAEAARGARCWPG